MYKRMLSVVFVCLLQVACAGYSGYRLQPGVATLPEVLAEMGPAAMHWQDADGSQQLAFPRGPMGVHTYMAYFAPDGRLRRLENVLESKHLARIQPGLDQQQVLRLIGPPNPAWTAYFEARDELVWEWLICDDWSKLARFDVLFDASSGRVRTAYQRPDLRGWDNRTPFCGH